MATLANSGPAARNYPLNCWWVAAFADEVTRTPLARWLLDTPVVLFRTEAGEAVALEDRCPHRQAPLSIGKLHGDAIECGYHGFQFNREGRCTFVPTMSSPPPIRVATYPVREIGPLIWIYLGDKDRLDAVPPPPVLGWIEDPAFSFRKGLMPVAANYLLLKENVLDLSHFGFVHASSFQITDWVVAPVVTRGEGTVRYRQEFVRAPLPGPMAAGIGVAPHTPWNRVYEGGFLSPAAQEGGVDLADPDGKDPRVASTRFAHFTTPIDQGNMYYFYVVARNFAREDAALDFFAELVKKGFEEDEFVLEQVQKLASRTPRRGSQGERSVKADAAGVEARRIVDEWMARETIHD
ncbi:vanillate O-demethylase monooxygenase subunit [Novosphingobium chloroacetimidivorans]|uniref:Vanillate O-demethylase monooxygenase subunit n=1 Tax=Novosphingobium chloroacetimidivorans TaxID=1428314 RepID=A0A7W7K9T7_9SPHN|nr:aromatic ring-hydroxylating dioxygenase subunit alpha [Novosphingobium chloroacetimidivorans]MBB4858630.1 vanillate O-demethylase monooxygenase subunit [Novosphingobium chloroacetimidivorans]